MFNLRNKKSEEVAPQKKPATQNMAVGKFYVNRKIARAIWIKTRTKDEKGEYTPTWFDFKEKYQVRGKWLNEELRVLSGGHK